MLTMKRLLAEATDYEELTGFPEVILNNPKKAVAAGEIDATRHREVEKALEVVTEFMYTVTGENDPQGNW